MADRVERIVLEVDDAKAILAARRTNAALEKTEKAAGLAVGSLGRVVDSVSSGIVSTTDRSLSSIEKVARAAESKAAAIGKSQVQRLMEQQKIDVSRVSGDPRAVDRVTAAYQKLIKEQERVASSSNKIFDAIRNPFQAAGDAVESFVGKLGKVGTIAVGAVAGLAFGAKAALDFTSAQGKLAEQTLNLSERLGTSATEAQHLIDMSNIAGVSVGGFETAMRQLSSAIVDGTEEGKRGAGALRDLGVIATTSAGELKPTYQLFQEIGGALGKIQNPAERANTAVKLFGRGALELLPLFRDFAGLSEKAGTAMDESLIRNLARFDDQMDVVEKRWRELKATLAGGIVAVIDLVQENRQPELRPGLRGGFFDQYFFTGKRPGVPEQRQISGPDFSTSAAARIAQGTALSEAFKQRLSGTEAGLQDQLTKAQEARRIAVDAAERPGQLVTVAKEKIDAANKAISAENRLTAAIKARAEAEAKANATQKASLEFQATYKTGAYDPQFGGSTSADLDILARRIEEEEKLRDSQRAFSRETAQLSVENTQARLSQEEQLIQISRERQLDGLQGFEARTLEQKVANEQKRAKIETDSAFSVFQLRLRLIQLEQEADLARVETVGQSEEAVAKRISEIRTKYGIQAADLENKARAEIESQQTNSTNRIGKLVLDEQQRSFDNAKRSIEGLFDAGLAGARNFWDAFKRIALTTAFAPLKELFSNFLAGILTGQRSSSGGAGGILGGIAGIGGLRLGGIGSAGAPGGTGGFAGPVGGIASTGGGFGSAFGALNAGTLGLGGAALGLMGAFKAGQSGNKFLKASAPAIGAVSGLLGFGALSYLFPSLIAAGPIGWIAAAGIGATIGIVAILKKSAEQKIVEKVKSLYGITINSGFAKDPLAGIIKQSFGGNIDVGIRSPQVRDLIELYAMSTGQNPAGGFSYANRQPMSLQQRGGSVYQTTPSLSGLYSPGTSLASRGQAAPIVIQSVVLQVNGQSAADLVDGRAAAVIQSNPRAIQSAVHSAQRGNFGRKETLSQGLSPTLLTTV